MREFQITNTDAGRRLDRWLALRLPQAGTGFLYKMLRKKNITLNDRKAAGPETLKAGDVVKIWFSEETFRKFAGDDGFSGTAAARPKESELSLNINIHVLYEDEDVLIMDKPAGVLSQKSASDDVSVNEMIAAYLGHKDVSVSGTFRPAACHRLDRNTSGILVCGKSYRGLKTMTELIRTREVQKDYLCLVRGSTPETMDLRDLLVKDEASNTVRVVDEKEEHAREALLSARTLAVSSDRSVSLLRVRLETGRSHQIRVQLAHAGHPVLGDRKYGDERVCGVKALPAERKIRRPMLHAYELIFPSGADGDRIGPSGTVTAPVPDDMRAVMKGAGIAWPPGIPED